jgi:branched-chain amino acid transport system ATP-binding protein
MSLLEIRGLSAGYGPLRVLHDLDMTVESGERVGLIGLNGHGKSTLLQSIVGLTGWQSGSILLDGYEIGGRRAHGSGRTTPKIVRRGVALAPQGDAIFPGLTVRQNLDTGAFTSRAWRERRKRRTRVLEIFPPLAKLLDQSVGTLSGGERRMVSLGRAFMGDPRVFLVDEPSLGLAPIISRSVVAALGEIDIGDGAMIIAEQDLGLIQGRVDRMLGMHAGELKQDIGDALLVGHAQSQPADAQPIEPEE